MESLRYRMGNRGSQLYIMPDDVAERPQEQSLKCDEEKLCTYVLRSSIYEAIMMDTVGVMLSKT